MASNVLTLPRTQRGKALLRLCVRLCRGWDLHDGSNAADTDWDQAAIDAERDNAAYDRWLAERGEGS